MPTFLLIDALLQ